MPKIRTTIRPLEELDVSEAEATDLRAQGLLLESTATTADGLYKAAIDQHMKRVSGAQEEATVAAPTESPAPKKG